MKNEKKPNEMHIVPKEKRKEKNNQNKCFQIAEYLNNVNKSKMQAERSPK